MSNIKTRKPTGKVAFPVVLLAGEPGAGKTWTAVEATSMEEVGRAFFLELGEGQADEYGAVPGADFEIIEHDGSIGQVREAIAWASQQPVDDGKYNLMIFDSMTELWALISNEAQVAANRRGRGKKNPDGDRQITMDLWNRATDTFEGIVSQLRKFPGPVLMTARMKITAIVGPDGQPTGAKDWKIESQKNLPYRAQVVVEARQPRVWTMTKIATTVPSLQLHPGKETTFNDFSVADLLRTMGVTPETRAPQVSTARPQGDLSDEAEASREEKAQQAAQLRKYEVWESEQMDKLIESEAGGDVVAVERVRDWFSQNNHRRLAQVSGQIVERMKATQQAPPTADNAVDNAQQVLDAEVVPDAG